MNEPNIYLLPKPRCAINFTLDDMTAAIALLRETYTVIRCGNAPLNIGLVYQTAEAVSECDQITLGLLPWH